MSLLQIAGDIRVGFPGVGGVRPCVGPLAISDFAEKPPGRKVGGFQRASRLVSGAEQIYPIFSYVSTHAMASLPMLRPCLAH